MVMKTLHTQKVVIIGTGGMGREVLWMLKTHNQIDSRLRYDVLGFLTNASQEHDTRVCEMPVLGPEGWVVGKRNIHAICAIGDPRHRRRLTMNLETQGVSFISVIDPSVKMSEFVNIGKGCILCAGVVLTTQVSIGNHVIVNINSTINHDTVLEDYVTIGPGATLTGRTRLGYGAEIGANATIIPRKEVGRGSIVGAGAVVTRNIGENKVAAGVPARVIKMLPVDQRL
ncbi:MAG: acetyltransferase [Thermodesulfobacteriota bacterium]